MGYLVAVVVVEKLTLLVDEIIGIVDVETVVEIDLK
jgi:hypothetical protein